MMGKLVVQALVILMISAAEVLCVDAPDLVGLVQSGDTSALLQRVGHGESANVPNKNGNLPLVTAGMWPHLKLVDTLVDTLRARDLLTPSLQHYSCWPSHAAGV